MSGSPIDSFPALIPVPASSKASSPTPSAAKTRAQLDRETEEAFDKFSTLFSPPTPRASPILDPLTLPAETQSTYAAQNSPDSEFGSFVSVPAAQDPLSLMTPGLGLPPPMQPASPAESAARSNHPRSIKQARPPRRIADARGRSAVLAERPVRVYIVSAEDDDDDDLLPSQKPNPYLTDSLSDLDFEFFASSHAKATPHRRSSSTSSHLRSPTRSPTVTAAPTLAPPLASPSTSADAPGFDAHARNYAPARSNSYASLATLSKSAGAKWVASFLPNALSPPAASVPNTSMFPPSPTPSASSSLSSSLTLPPHPAPAPAPARVPDLSHFTPFAPSHADGAYVPPSGAPGFRGGSAYDWDRGFSHALERDLGVSAAPTPYSDSDPGEELVSHPRNERKKTPDGGTMGVG
ncbi:hypothetical protein FB451DRAFT_1564434, partial [Mycena latifolia]